MISFLKKITIISFSIFYILGPFAYTPKNPKELSINLAEASNPIPALNPRLWLDSADASTLFTTAAGSTNAVVGDPVGRWEDKSGNNFHLDQTTTSRRPTLTSSGLKFDGANTSINRGSTNIFRNIAGGTIFVVKKDDSYIAHNQAIVELNSTTQTKAGIGTSSNARYQIRGQRIESDSGTQRNSSQNTSLHYTEVITGLFDYANGQISMLRNKAEEISPQSLPSSGNSQNVNVSTLMVGTPTNQTVRHYDGLVKEIVIFDELLSPADIDAVNDWLIEKWEIIENPPVYKVPHILSVGRTVANGEFLPVGHGSASDTFTTEEQIQLINILDGRWSRMGMYVYQANDDADTTITFRINGVDTDLEITVPQGQTGFFSNLVDIEDVSSTDLLSFGVSMTSGVIGISSVTLAYETVGGNGNSQQYFISTSSNNGATGGRFIRISGTAVENVQAQQPRLVIPADMNSIHMSLFVRDNTRTSTTTISLREGGTNINNVSIPTTNTGRFNSNAVQGRNILPSYDKSYASGSGAVSVSIYQLTVIYNDPKKINLIGGGDSSNSTFTETTTDINNIFLGGRKNNAAGNIDQYRSYIMANGELSNYSLFFGNNGYTEDTRGRVLINGSNGNQTILVPASTANNFTDNINTDLVGPNDWISETWQRVVGGGSGTTNVGGSSVMFEFVEPAPEPTISQSNYRFFENSDSTDVGSPLDAQNTPVILPSPGYDFRLRLLLNINDADLGQGGEDFKLQFVDKGSGTCSAPSGGTPSSYTDVTDSTLISFFDNSTPSDGSNLSANAGDPTDGGRTIVNQTYEELNNFTNSTNQIDNGESGKWDFSLYDNGSDPDTVFCFRVVKSNGDLLDLYSQYPEIQTYSPAGSLSVDIVDNTDTPVISPFVFMDTADFSFTDQTSSGMLGISDQKIRVSNGTSNAVWTLSLAADNGPTSLWSSGSQFYDFNDPTINAGDGADTDSYGGQMTINPSGAIISPEAGCTTTNISLGPQESFSEGSVDSITVASAASGADINCYWDITDIDISQTIPAEQPAGSYSIDMTLSIIAS